MKTIFILLPFLANLAFGQYKLALNLQKGNTYSLAFNSTTKFVGETNGQKTVVSALSTGIMRFKVINSSDTGYTLEASCDSFRFSMKTPLGKMEFISGDSSMEDGQPTANTKRPGDKHFNITVYKNGAVNKIENPDTAGFARMFSHLPMAEMIKRFMMAGNLRKQFNHQAMKENLEKLTAIFPDKKVALNESWGSVIHSDSSTGNEIKIDNQLTAYSPSTATITSHRQSTWGNTGTQKKALIPAHKIKIDTVSVMQVNTNSCWISEVRINTLISVN
jgi:Family of unknown function (DUF6263)